MTSMHLPGPGSQATTETPIFSRESERERAGLVEAWRTNHDDREAGKWRLKVERKFFKLPVAGLRWNYG